MGPFWPMQQLLSKMNRISNDLIRNWNYDVLVDVIQNTTRVELVL
jgi:hypothetical protein